ncbi:hypothetical protein EJ110_NYTH44012 [Nymphaea thermarum]|nr:hypothetical protein EJ110_NYTH44012 [Nymphaea thermarum]
MRSPPQAEPKDACRGHGATHYTHEHGFCTVILFPVSNWVGALYAQSTGEKEKSPSILSADSSSPMSQSHFLSFPRLLSDHLPAEAREVGSPEKMVTSVREPPLTPLAVGLFTSIKAMVALCAKHCPTKEVGFSCFRAGKNIETSAPPKSPNGLLPVDELRMNLSPGSLLVLPRVLLLALTHKAMAVFHMKSTAEEGEEAETAEDGEEEGVWKRQILMGERCQPLDFSGVIYYDHTGKQLQDYFSPSDDHNSAASYVDTRDGQSSLKVPLRRPVGSPRALLAALSRKAGNIFKREKTRKEAEGVDEADGLWKRKILMGERCQLPDFSGAIYYDHTGTQLPELPPKSPASLSFPVVDPTPKMLT